MSEPTRLPTNCITPASALLKEKNSTEMCLGVPASSSWKLTYSKPDHVSPPSTWTQIRSGIVVAHTHAAGTSAIPATEVDMAAAKPNRRVMKFHTGRHSALVMIVMDVNWAYVSSSMCKLRNM